MQLVFCIRDEINTANLLLFLEETEKVFQQLMNRDKQLKEIEMKVRENYISNFILFSFFQRFLIYLNLIQLHLILII